MRTPIALLILSGFLATSAQADDSRETGFFFGGALGFSTFDDDGAGNDFDADFEDFSGAAGVFGGYRFGKYFALESRFTYLGDGASDTTLKSTALTGHVVGIYPLSRWAELYGQVGAGAVFVNDDVDEFMGGESLDNEVIGTIGLGVRMWATDQAAFRVQYDYYTWEADFGPDDYDVAYGVFQLGLEYNF